MTTTQAPEAPRTTMNGKPVVEVDAKSVLNLQSGFAKKLLCDGPTFSFGDACAYKCAFCYVPSMFTKLDRVREAIESTGRPHEDLVIRRKGALEILRSQLLHPNGKRKFPDPEDRRVVYSSPSVDVAANMTLVRETIEACKLILTFTAWHIRLLSKSNLLPKVAEALAPWKDRVIYGVSTGTLDDRVAEAFEEDTPKVSARIKSLLWLQDNGYRTFGMICPSLPIGQADLYHAFAQEAYHAIRAWKCEHVWAEVINVRGESMVRTVQKLAAAGFQQEAALLRRVSEDSNEWEDYNRATFLAHAAQFVAYPGKLRYLTYTTKATHDWWASQTPAGAVLL